MKQASSSARSVDGIDTINTAGPNKRKASDDINDRATKSFCPSSSSATSAAKPLPALLTLLGISPWDPSCIPPSNPPLPTIGDPTIEDAVFTHASAVPRPDGFNNYEQLEFVGDAYLELISTELVDYTFAGLIKPGRCAQVREILIRNITLAEFCRAYDLEKRLRVSKNFWVNVKPHEQTKVAADIFEAYVAGVIKSDPHDGLRRAVTWLRDLWAIKIQDRLRTVASQQNGGLLQNTRILSTGLSSDAKTRLAKAVLIPKIATLRYEDLKPPTKSDDGTGSVFHIGVYLDGWGAKNKLLGIGNGLSKKEAGDKAATTALANSTLIKTYQSRKEAFLAARGDAQEVEGN